MELFLERGFVKIVKLGKKFLWRSRHFLYTGRTANINEMTFHNPMLGLLGDFIVGHHETMPLSLRKVTPNLVEILCVGL